MSWGHSKVMLVNPLKEMHAWTGRGGGGFPVTSAVKQSSLHSTTQRRRVGDYTTSFPKPSVMLHLSRVVLQTAISQKTAALWLFGGTLWPGAWQHAVVCSDVGWRGLLTPRDLSCSPYTDSPTNFSACQEGEGACRDP